MKLSAKSAVTPIEKTAERLSADDSRPSLTGGRLLARNVIWNGGGELGPLIAAAAAIPVLIHQLGTARFGVLALAWMLFGYFSLFDVGLGRAATKLVADKLGEGRRQEIPALVWTALLLTAAFALVGALIMLAAAPWAVHRMLKVPADLQVECVDAFYVLALSLPLVACTGALRGVLAAFQRFDLLNLVRGPLGMFSFLGPLVVLPLSKSLVAMAAVLMAGRLVGFAAHLIQCLLVVPGLKHGIRVESALMRLLLTFGGWMTVSNIVSPLMTYMDRLLLASMVSMEAVAYYATPSEMVTKLLLMPVILLTVLFPAFAHSYAQGDDRALVLYERAVKLIFLTMFPAILLIVVFAGEILSLWLGASFAQHSTRALQWLAFGILMNSLAQAPFALIQAIDRPDLTAKLHLLELPVYALAAWWLIRAVGVEGAAIAWAARVTIDALALFIVAQRLMRRLSRSAKQVGWLTLAAVSALAVCLMPTGFAARASLALGVLAALAIVAWVTLLGADERALVRRYLGTEPSSRPA
jgi:O-antigen/teichoic acid export membrane protein